MNDNLSKEYYVHHDGTADEFAQLLNCFQAGLYFNLKSKKNVSDPYELFIMDPTFRVDIYRDGTFRDMEAIHLWGCREVFRTTDVKGRGLEALREMKALLAQGEILIFDTHMSRMPFFERFVGLDAYYDAALHQTPYNHLFVAIGQTDVGLIYVESPHLLTSAHIGYNHSACIGVIEDSILQHAADCFLNYRRIHILEDGLSEEALAGRVVSTLHSILASTNRPPYEFPDYTRHYGNEGIVQLIAGCQTGRLEAGDYSHQHESLHQAEVLLWKFRNVKQQLALLYHSVNRHADRLGHQAPLLLSALRTYMESVEILVSKLRIMQIRNKYHTNGLAEAFVRIKDSNARWMDVIAEWAGAVPQL